MLRRLLSKREWKSIRAGTMAMLLCVNVVIILLLSLGAFSFYQQSFVDEIAGARSDVLRQIAERARQFKTNIYTLSNLYYNDGRFHTAVEELDQDHVDDFTRYMDGLTSQFQVSFNQVNLDFYVVFLSESSIGYCSISTPEGYDYMNPKIKIWYSDIYQAQGEIVDVASYRDRLLGINAYSAARTVLDGQGEIIGYLMINADERQLYQMYADVISTESNIYVVDSEGQIVSSSRDTIIGFSYFHMQNLESLFGDQDHIITRISGRPALFTRYYDPESGFTVFEEIPLTVVLRPIERIRLVVLALALLALAGGTVMAWVFSGRIAAPLRKLCADVRQVEEGDLNQTFDMDSFSELNDLSTGMARMLGRIRELIESVRTKEEEKRRMELSWLQAQINPHFMYNTLFSIKCSVDMGRNEEAGHMLTTFIQMLRGVLSAPEEMVTIRAQMESLQQYVELQRFRYDGAFDALIEYDEQAAGCRIPKLLIQPLVENAILHGVDMTDGGGMITVIARRQGEAVSIQVEDNGVGMTQARIREVMTAREDSGRPHLGIRNIHERIRLHYGEPWGLQIESTPGQGTQITLLLPALESPEETDKGASHAEGSSS